MKECMLTLVVECLKMSSSSGVNYRMQLVCFMHFWHLFLSAVLLTLSEKWVLSCRSLSCGTVVWMYRTHCWVIGLVCNGYYSYTASSIQSRRVYSLPQAVETRSSQMMLGVLVLCVFLFQVFLSVSVIQLSLAVPGKTCLQSNLLCVSC